MRDWGRQSDSEVRNRELKHEQWAAMGEARTDARSSAGATSSRCRGRQSHPRPKAYGGPVCGGGEADATTIRQWPECTPTQAVRGEVWLCQYAESRDRSHGMAAERFIGLENTDQAALQNRMAGKKSMPPDLQVARKGTWPPKARCGSSET